MKMTKKKALFIPVFLLAIIGVFAFAMIPSANIDNTDSVSITYHSNVCKTVTRADGTIEPTDCSHNLLFTSGKELIETYLGDTGGASDEVDQIALCDADIGCATPTAAAGETWNLLADRGLTTATGTYASVGDGNYTISNTFTATGSVSTNVTRLQNTAGTNFAGNNFTLVSLESGDSLEISWNIWVS